MGVNVVVPAVGESITEVVIGKWLAREGDLVAADASVVELETDKVNAEVPAPVAGRLTRILKAPGETARVGETIAVIEPESGAGSRAEPTADDAKASSAAERPAKGQAKAVPSADAPTERVRAGAAPFAMPSAQRELAQRGVEAGQVAASGPGGRVLGEDVRRHAEEADKGATPSKGGAHAKSEKSGKAEKSGGESDSAAAAKAAPAEGGKAAKSAPAARRSGERDEQLVPMTPMRKRIAERLVQAQQTAAMLTTFNEIDMSAVMALRKRHQESFQAKHGIKLGYMSFFVKASIEALKACPELNASIEGDAIRYHGYYDIGVAVGSGRGLVVPVLRDAERMSFAEVEKSIADFGARAKDRKLKLEELQGGTFTISNGGVYGSMLSTPILNGAQSGILGMHNIVERPVAVDGAVVVRPVMYVALTYDHRLVDGREAVGFLVALKGAIEDPARILLEV